MTHLRCASTRAGLDCCRETHMIGWEDKQTGNDNRRYRIFTTNEMELENVFLFGDGQGPNSSLMIANDDVIHTAERKEKSRAYKGMEKKRSWDKRHQTDWKLDRLWEAECYRLFHRQSWKKKFLRGSRLKLFHRASFFAALSNGKTFERKRATSATSPSRMFRTRTTFRLALIRVTGKGMLSPAR